MKTEAIRRLARLTRRTETYTHFRCGGNLIPIPDPPWFLSRHTGIAASTEFVRCDRCGLPGISCDPPRLGIR